VAAVAATLRRPVAPAVVRRCACRRLATLSLLGAALVAVTLLAFGGKLLVSPDALPADADVLVVLMGSDRAGQARREEALRLFREGRARNLAISAAQVKFWGEWVPDLMRRYLERQYGKQEADRAVLCPHNADSTLEEAQALRPCLEGHGWHTVIVVTSNFHTRRARHIWEGVFADAQPPVRVFVHGVADGEFEPNGWWRNRRYAKTFLFEVAKLAWAYTINR
jgi:uncharacterized SAM-binding protein YcdF (DUF218 family)